jgi:hypothetical protein
MKLTKKDHKTLCSILEQLERGQTFLMSEETLVCRRRSMKTTTLDLTNESGEVCAAIAKDIGSELTLLHTGISQLRKLLSGENV